ncbi:hypothetical protein [Sphingobacterium siyangense]|uniref:hypothetical protein n=1 Tax=Sphingobacterium siyangense TaxID=459529 RepID=UPI003DA5FD74
MEYNTDLGQFDFTLIRGVSEQVKFWDVEKVDDKGKIIPWDLTGKTVKIHFKTYESDSAFAMEKSVDNGGVVIDKNSITVKFGDETLSLKRDVYYYDILIIDNSERNTIVQGKLTLTGVITK